MGFFFYLLNDIKCLQTRCREQKVNMKKQKQVINVLAKSNMRQSCNLLQFLHSSSLFGFAMATTRFASTPNDKYEIKIDGTPAPRTEMQVRVCLVTTKFPNFPNFPSHLLSHRNIKYSK